jgi:Fe-Mn family superoxide dismutase
LGLPPLPYDESALEPAISRRTVRLHHDKHQAAYVQGVNTTLGRLHELRVDPNRYGNTARQAMRLSLYRNLAFNAAGAHLHDLYWRNLTSRGKGGQPSSELGAQVQRDFGSWASMLQEVSDVGKKIQGSGWVVLAWSQPLRRLVVLPIEDHQNQSPVGSVPLLVLDVWEHAYYLDTQNDRGKYLDRLLTGYVNWPEVSRRFQRAVV